MRRPVLPAPGGGTTTLFPESVRALAPNLLPQSLCGEERLARARRVGAGGGPSGISSGERYREAMVMPLRRRFRCWECRADRGRQRHWDRPRGNRFPLIHQGRRSCFRRLNVQDCVLLRRQRINRDVGHSKSVTVYTLILKGIQAPTTLAPHLLPWDVPPFPSQYQCPSGWSSVLIILKTVPYRPDSLLISCLHCTV